MEVFIEGAYYPLKEVQSSFESTEFYCIEGDQCKVTKVGYNHSSYLNRISLVLPKVFMKDSKYTVFEDLTPLKLLAVFQSKNETISIEIQKIAFNFYRGLKRFESTVEDSKLVNFSKSYRLKHKHHEHRFSYLDIVLSFLDFHKKFKDIILYKFLDSTSAKANKINWNKTVSKQLPILTQQRNFIYDERNIKIKTRDNTETLILLYYSILNYFNECHVLGLRIDNNIPIYKGFKFESLRTSGLQKLKSIRHNYFSDVFRKMYVLVELFFDIENKGAIEHNEEFLSTDNYNIVFEEMVDKLLSDRFEGINDDKEIQKLKKNKDGKIIDHIFKYKSLFDDSEIYYIGDSKYYKSDSRSSGVSTYKQFTYTKNILQYHISKLNASKKLSGKIRYRDAKTEGYNITPNFFIYGSINDYKDWNLNEITSIGDPYRLSHFVDRLFDRDSLFVFEYKLNYLFILQAYLINSKDQFDRVRGGIKETIFLDLKKWFLESDKCDFDIYELESELNYTDIWKYNLYGKCYSTVEGKFLLSLHRSEKLNVYKDLISHKLGFVIR